MVKDELPPNSGEKILYETENGQKELGFSGIVRQHIMAEYVSFDRIVKWMKIEEKENESD